MKYFCCDERRRSLLQTQNALNGIDYLEVLDDPGGPPALRQRRLHLFFVHPPAPGDLAAVHFRIEGGERTRGIRVVSATPGTTTYASPPAQAGIDLSRLMVVDLDRAGDYSAYTLRLVNTGDPGQPPDGFDAHMAAVDFSFKVGCSGDIDCHASPSCPQPSDPAPEINYLSKDYVSFKQLMLDRMATLMPDWLENHAADMGMTLVELLAYVGDYLSYQQDAVATEAYLHTARRRISVKRHVRLVDYPMHDGSNSRAWIHLRVRPGAGPIQLNADDDTGAVRFFTRLKGQGPVIAPGKIDFQNLLSRTPRVFEPMHGLMLRAEHNRMTFHTWGARACCLPRGATTATLRGHYPQLQSGHVLILMEVRGPETGQRADADPACRQAVRLTGVTLGSDPLGVPPPSMIPEDAAPDPGPQPVTEITWHTEDALAFPLCISSEVGNRHVEDVSIALGNIVLVDHGMTFRDEAVPASDDPGRRSASLDPQVVPTANPVLTAGRDTNRHCESSEEKVTMPRFRPGLQCTPLTQAEPGGAGLSRKSALAVFEVEPRKAVPQITLREAADEQNVWQARRDLLSSGSDSKAFVVEVESDGSTFLRFGDDRHGSFPSPGTRFLATYRIGNGTEGNVGADSLAHIVTDDPVITTDLLDPVIQTVTNPLPAAGGVAAETLQEARQYAPQAFRIQKRAVTPDDYETQALKCAPDMQRAAATPRWTGSWRTIFLTADRKNAAPVTEPFKRQLRQCLEPLRMAGHDLHIDSPRFVSLELEMTVCIQSGYLAHELRTALLEIFSTGLLPDGRRGLFHPDNFTFGQTVYLSPFVAAAQQTEGVASAVVTKFQRRDAPGDKGVQDRRLELARMEIARLDNDPNFPERGVFNLNVKGGR